MQLKRHWLERDYVEQNAYNEQRSCGMNNNTRHNHALHIIPKNGDAFAFSESAKYPGRGFLHRRNQKGSDKSFQDGAFRKASISSSPRAASTSSNDWHRNIVFPFL